ncbi:LytR/AlgR family response regulator transcription factor [Sphingomonas canadensis]|uniref:LytR/AlgR family response regulator transcription factor n=1 Tax=Sphingomonas canadensis TaxID=1219257 RepID=A0ABW3H8J3_9SPHN|nr:LytTR family DNA-binding domain-containing protein [Sphingomonas canadensis]MCW3836479.1 LytTR family DNA-binding domain-containing protein [Sphingomonas canadensis]
MATRTEPICALVADDEAPARRRIADLLARDRSIGKVVLAENGVDALTKIREAAPDIVFLDVQMPGLDGLGVADAMGGKMPLTVFVTAYDRFAIHAFERDAVDYLLKPFSDRRYEQMMCRVKERLADLRSRGEEGGSTIGPELLKLIEKRSTPGGIWEWIAIKSRDTTRLLMTDDIDWVEAAGVYVSIHAKGEEFLYRAGLTAVASRLDPFRFVRIHRTSIVNVKSIALLERRSHGEFDVILHCGKRLPMSRTYRDTVEAVLGQPL